MTNMVKHPDDLAKIEPSFFDFGMGFDHNMPCAIYHSGEDQERAILNCNTGVFGPSGKARLEGWRLVRAQTKLQKWLLRKFF